MTSTSHPVALNPSYPSAGSIINACVVVAEVAEKPSDRVNAGPVRGKINKSLLSHRRALPRLCGWVDVVPMVVEAAFANSAFAHGREVEGQRHAWQLGRPLLVAVAVCAQICFALNDGDSCGVKQDR